MAKDFDLQSPKWLEIIFEGKNKRYGAYQLRNDSSNRHLKSLIIVTIIGLAAVFLPNIIENMLPAPDSITEETAISLTDFESKKDTEKKDDIQDMDIPVQEVVVLAKSIMLTEAEIVDDAEIQEKNLALVSDALKDLDSQISTQTIEDGTTVEGAGVNIDDYRQVAVDETDDKEDKKIYTWVQVKPSFPGGEEARLKWLRDNLEYPQQAIMDEIQGQVQVGFVVEKDGSITDVKIVQSAHSSLDREAIRLVKAMPKWIPGKQNGNTVRAYFTQPIRFVLK